MDKRKEDLVVGDVIHYRGWLQAEHDAWAEFLVITEVRPKPWNPSIQFPFRAKDLCGLHEGPFELKYKWSYLCHINDFGSV